MRKEDKLWVIGLTLSSTGLAVGIASGDWLFAVIFGILFLTFCLEVLGNGKR